MATLMKRCPEGGTPSQGGNLFKQQLDPRHIPGQRALRRRVLRAARRKERDEARNAETSSTLAAHLRPANGDPG